MSHQPDTIRDEDIETRWSAAPQGAAGAPRTADADADADARDADADSSDADSSDADSSDADASDAADAR